MSQSSYIRKQIIVAIALSLMVNACTGHLATPSPTVEIPSSISGTTARATATRDATATSAPLRRTVEAIAPPRVLINTGEHSLDEWTCDNQLARGQVWLVEYPYNKPRLILSATDTGFYQPVWSPDGRRFAYIAVNTTNAKSVIVPLGDGTTTTYAGGDSIWVMQLDDSKKTQVSDQFDRVQYLTASTDRGNCTILRQIDSILGWSFDARWIAFHYTILTSKNESVAFAVDWNALRSSPLESVSTDWHSSDQSQPLDTTGRLDMRALELPDRVISMVWSP